MNENSAIAQAADQFVQSVKALDPRAPDPEVPPVVLAIARVAHEVNRSYCVALGDHSQLPWEAAPDWQKRSAINGVTLHLNDPKAGPEASHKSWMAEKLADGWVYGPFKDAERKTHPCLVPFVQLPTEQRAKDHIFCGVVRAIAQEQSRD